MRTVFVTRGLPGSGKSTWARQVLAADPDRWVRVNKDELRSMMFGPDFRWSKDLEEATDEAQENVLRTVLRKGRDAIVDNTHLTVASVRRVHEVAESVGDVLVTVKTFDTPLEECIARDAVRVSPVGESVIRGMWKKHLAKSGFADVPDRHFAAIVDGPTAVQDPFLPEAIVVDLDGTAALIGDRNVYDASRCDEVDAPNVPVVAVVTTMHIHRGAHVIFVSGRDEKYREPTKRFIDNHFRIDKMDMFEEPIPYKLYMRPAGDTRKDKLVKREIYEREIKNKVRVLFVMDDRPSVVRMWRHELGLCVFALNDREF